MSKITIVLPTWNRRHVLERSLASYIALARSHALIVVDDGSADGTSDWLTRQGITVVRHVRRRGPSAARNTGLRHAKTPWVLFGEDDVIMPIDHPDRLLEEALRLPRCGAVAGRLFNVSGWELPETLPAAGPRLLAPERLLADFSAALTGPEPVPSLHGCAMVNRAAMLAVGGFDEGYVDSAFREESEGHARLWHGGWGCWLTPATWSIHVRHRLGGGCRGRPDPLSKLRNRWSYWRNDCRYITRHHALWTRFSQPSPEGVLKARSLLHLVRVTAAAALSARPPTGTR